MRHFLILLRHELRMLLISPSTYIAGVLFLTLMGFLYWAILRNMANSSEETLVSVQFFKVFWIPVFFVVPLLTMRSIAGERNAGTLDTLFTTPISRASVVLSKFAAAYIFYLLLWSATLCFPAIVAHFFPQTAASGDLFNPASLRGGFAFLAASGILFIAIGIFASSLTKSQLVAGMLSFAIIFAVIVGGQQLGNITQFTSHPPDWLTSTVNYLQIFEHLDSFARGIVDTRPFFFYTSTGCMLLALSACAIEAKS
ncbi:MAG: ABC transporter permease [Opitutales bacterium]